MWNAPQADERVLSAAENRDRVRGPGSSGTQEDGYESRNDGVGRGGDELLSGCK